MINIGNVSNSQQQRCLIDLSDGRPGLRKYYNSIANLSHSDFTIRHDCLGTPEVTDGNDAIQIDSLPAGLYRITLKGGTGNDSAAVSTIYNINKTSGDITPQYIDIGNNITQNIWVTVERLNDLITPTDTTPIITTRLYFTRSTTGGGTNNDAYIDRSKAHYVNNFSTWADAMRLKADLCPINSTVFIYNYNNFTSTLELIDGTTGTLNPAYTGLTKTAGDDDYLIGSTDGLEVYSHLVFQVIAPDGSEAWYGTRGISGAVTNKDDYVPIVIERGGDNSENYINFMRWYYLGETRGANDSIVIADDAIEALKTVTIVGNGTSANGTSLTGNTLNVEIGDDDDRYHGYSNVQLQIANAGTGNDLITSTVDFYNLFGATPTVDFFLNRTAGSHRFDFSGVAGEFPLVIRNQTDSLYKQRLMTTGSLQVPELNDNDTLGGGLSVSAESDSRFYRLFAYNSALIEVNAAANNTFDATPPVSDTILINGGADYIRDFNVTISQSATDNPGGSGIRRMRYGNSPAERDAAPWVTYSTADFSHTLTSVAAGETTTIYFTYEDWGGNQRNGQKSVIYDPVPPYIPVGSELNSISPIAMNIHQGIYANFTVGARDDLSGMSGVDNVRLLMRPVGTANWTDPVVVNVPFNFAGGSVGSGASSIWSLNIGPTTTGSGTSGITGVTLSEGNWEYCALLADALGNQYYSPVKRVEVSAQKFTSFFPLAIPTKIRPDVIREAIAAIEMIVGAGGAKYIKMKVLGPNYYEEFTYPNIPSGPFKLYWCGRDHNFAKGKLLERGKYLITVETVGNYPEANYPLLPGMPGATFSVFVHYGGSGGCNTNMNCSFK